MAQKISFYFDEHVPRVVEQGLVKRGYKIIIAVDVGMIAKDDDVDHLPFASQNQAVVVTRDKPFAGRTTKRADHAGLICWTGKDDDFGGMVIRLSEFAEQHTPEEVMGKVFWLK